MKFNIININIDKPFELRITYCHLYSILLNYIKNIYQEHEGNYVNLIMFKTHIVAIFLDILLNPTVIKVLLLNKETEDSAIRAIK